MVSIDLGSPAESEWLDLVPEGDDVLEWATGVAGDKLITCYMHHVKNTLQLRELSSGSVVFNFKVTFKFNNRFGVFLSLSFCFLRNYILVGYRVCDRVQRRHPAQRNVL